MLLNQLESAYEAIAAPDELANPYLWIDGLINYIDGLFHHGKLTKQQYDKAYKELIKDD